MKPLAMILPYVASSVLLLACTDPGAPGPQAESGGTTGAETSAGDDPDGTVGGTSGTSGSGGSTGTPEGSTGETGSSSSTGNDPSFTDDGPVPSYPGQALDLSDWKLTLPTGSDEEPDEIFQPELDSFEQPPQFWLDDTDFSVVFRAEVDGVTTSGSSYPRSELREMLPGGQDEAAWSTTRGRHTMTIQQAILALPPNKPHVVAGQIHDSEDDLVMIRLEETHLFVEGGGDELGTLDPDYELGTVFTVRIVAENGTIDIYYEDLATPAVTVERDAEGCYFKAGAYTQSNLEYDEPGAYGEVAIHDLAVEHR